MLHNRPNILLDLLLNEFKTQNLYIIASRKVIKMETKHFYGLSTVTITVLF